MIKLSKLAEELHISVNTLYGWSKKGLITFVKSPTGRNYLTEEEYSRILNGKNEGRKSSIPESLLPSS